MHEIELKNVDNRICCSDCGYGEMDDAFRNGSFNGKSGVICKIHFGVFSPDYFVRMDQKD